MWLPDDTFKSIIQYATLISIDLIVRNEVGDILLGKRMNAPAKGYWFVPGGRVRKDELLDQAFIRLVSQELGIESGISRADAKFLGVFEHFYEDCVFGGGVSTHYVVLAYQLKIPKSCKLAINDQHSTWIWQDVELVKINNHIHKYTKDYFNEEQ